MTRRPPRPPPFPYPPLSRSRVRDTRSNGSARRCYRHGAKCHKDHLTGRSRRVIERTSLRFKNLAGATGKVDRKSTRLNSSHLVISYAVFCLKKKKKGDTAPRLLRWRSIQLDHHPVDPLLVRVIPAHKSGRDEAEPLSHRVSQALASVVHLLA